MQKQSLTKKSSLIVASAMILGLAYLSPAQPESKAGPWHVRTGVLEKIDGSQMILDCGKKGQNLMVEISPLTRIWHEVPADFSSLSVGQVMQVEGRGKLSQVEARRLLVLPATEQVKMAKTPKPGSAYGEKIKSVNVKAKVQKLNPLTIVNHNQQTLQVSLAADAKIFQYQPSDSSQLLPKAKVRVQYQERAGKLQVREVLILAQTE